MSAEEGRDPRRGLGRRAPARRNQATYVIWEEGNEGPEWRVPSAGILPGTE